MQKRKSKYLGRDVLNAQVERKKHKQKSVALRKKNDSLVQNIPALL